MKTKSKALLLALCAVLLVAASVLGTMAYLTSRAEVTNTFTVGSVSITLDEAPVDANGKETTGARVTTNSYKLMPGHEYDKDPTIHVAQNSEDCWLFVQITDEIAAIQDADTIATQMAANGWTLVDADANVYAHNAIAKAGNNVVVFESFKIKGDVKNDALAAYANKTINVIAYAVQADGFDTAAAAWTAAFAQN
ncbi:MAG: hypothetical protein IJE78_06760 [Bacteroidaceae bacterium]|nr:hypothetical protein [Bacteroidaceae bacterium]